MNKLRWTGLSQLVRDGRLIRKGVGVILREGEGACRLLGRCTGNDRVCNEIETLVVRADYVCSAPWREPEPVLKHCMVYISEIELVFEIAECVEVGQARGRSVGSSDDARSK